MDPIDPDRLYHPDGSGGRFSGMIDDDSTVRASWPRWLTRADDSVSVR